MKYLAIFTCLHPVIE